MVATMIIILFIIVIINFVDDDRGRRRASSRRVYRSAVGSRSSMANSDNFRCEICSSSIISRSWHDISAIGAFWIDDGINGRPSTASVTKVKLIFVIVVNIAHVVGREALRLERCTSKKKKKNCFAR